MSDHNKQLVMHFYISGRVQGVGYRISTLEKGRALGLSGWVRNLPDGRVETIASGAKDILDIFSHWLQQGPTGAKVESVDATMIEETESEEQLPYPFQIHR